MHITERRPRPLLWLTLGSLRSLLDRKAPTFGYITFASRSPTSNNANNSSFADRGLLRVLARLHGRYHPLPVDRFEALYTDHHGWLKNWLSRRLGNAADAADLAQDAFVRLWHGLSADNAPAARSYLRTMVNGMCTTCGGGVRWSKPGLMHWQLIHDHGAFSRGSRHHYQHPLQDKCDAERLPGKCRRCLHTSPSSTACAIGK